MREKSRWQLSGTCGAICNWCSHTKLKNNHGNFGKATLWTVLKVEMLWNLTCRSSDAETRRLPRDAKVNDVTVLLWGAIVFKSLPPANRSQILISGPPAKNFGFWQDVAKVRSGVCFDGFAKRNKIQNEIANFEIFQKNFENFWLFWASKRVAILPKWSKRIEIFWNLFPSFSIQKWLKTIEIFMGSKWNFENFRFE